MSAVEVRNVVFSTMLRDLLDSPGVGVSRKKLARALDVNEATISHYIHERARPSFDTLIKLADVLGVSLDYLVFGTKPTVGVEVETAGMRSQIRRALLEASDTAGRHADLVSRISRKLQSEIDAAARSLLEDPANLGPVGFINDNEAIGMEACIESMRIMTREFQSDVAGDDQGIFFDVVTQNLRMGRPYYYLLYGEYEFWVKRVETFRALVAKAAVTNEMSREYLKFRSITEELSASVCILSLNEPLVAQQEPILWERHKPGVTTDGTWAYISVERSDAQGGIVIEPGYLNSTLRMFERDWKQAREL